MGDFKWNEYTVILLVILGVLTGSMITMIGDIPECTNDPITWGNVFQILFSFCCVSLFGFLGGRNSK